MPGAPSFRSIKLVKSTLHIFHIFNTYQPDGSNLNTVASARS